MAPILSHPASACILMRDKNSLWYGMLSLSSGNTHFRRPGKNKLNQRSEDDLYITVANVTIPNPGLRVCGEPLGPFPLSSYDFWHNFPDMWPWVQEVECRMVNWKIEGSLWVLGYFSSRVLSGWWRRKPPWGDHDLQRRQQWSRQRFISASSEFLNMLILCDIYALMPRTECDT